MQWTVSVLCGIPGPGRSHMLWNNLARMPQLSQCSKEAHKNENAPQCSTKREATARGSPALKQRPSTAKNKLNKENQKSAGGKR